MGVALDFAGLDRCMGASLDYRPNCASCASLCCMALSFDKSEDFGFDKAAGEACCHLDACGKCKIFNELEGLGFRGCVTFSCYGAGQRVTQEVFDGADWRDRAELKHRMGEALRILRRIHEHLLLLETAKVLNMSEAERHRLEGLERDLGKDRTWSEESLLNFQIEPVCSAVSDFLQSLRPHISDTRSESKRNQRKTG